jgi:glutamyl-tRNA reductase
VAVDLALSIFGDLQGRRVLLVGAGEMSEQAAVHLRAAGAGEIVVVNRTQSRGRTLAESIEGRYVEWEELEAALGGTDIVVTSTGSTDPVIGRSMMKRVMKSRRGAPIFLVDIAVPRDVDPAVARLDQVFLYNVDDLQDLVHENMENRAAEAELAGRVVDEEVSAFLKWERTRAAAPVLRQLQEHARGIVGEETQKALQKLGELSPDQQKIVETLAHQVTQKILHRPMKAVRDSAGTDEGDPQLAGALARLFWLAAERDSEDEDPS